MKKYKIPVWILLIVTSSFFSLVYGQISNLDSVFLKRTHTMYSKTLPYRLALPANYSSEETYPLVLALHGSGSRGHNNAGQLNSTVATMWAEERIQNDHPCFVVVPQCPFSLSWWSQLDIIDHLLNTLMQEYSIDATRLYVVGVSMGGFGVWDLIQTSIFHFAAAVPISGGAYNDVWPLVTHIPAIWNFHGTLDNSVPVSYSRSTIVTLEKLLGIEAVYPDLKTGIPSGLTEDEFDSLLNDGAGLIYSESATTHGDTPQKMYLNPKVPEWLFARETDYYFPEKPALPTTPESFAVTTVGSDPVLDQGSAGTWDDWRLQYPSVIKDGDTLKMWYLGARQDYNQPQIGYAWSLDGIDWHRYAGNPVMSADLPWENSYLQNMSVIKDGSVYRMWYSAGSAIGYAWSMDGRTWTKNPDPVLLPGNDGEWDYFDVGVGTVLKENDSFKMWYSGGHGFIGTQIGYATSTDGMIWTKYNDPSTQNPPYSDSDPVLKEGRFPEDWDFHAVTRPAIYAGPEGYEMWYIGISLTTGVLGYIHYAVSPDGVEWFKSETNPVLHDKPLWLGEGGYGGNSVLKIGNEYHLWYSYIELASGKSRIGYARDLASAVQNETEAMPLTFNLEQNYPNPFNPSTTIKFQIPNAQFTTLKIYNLLGKEVATLVSQNLRPGTHSYTFDGKNLASGVYYYKLVAGEYQEVRKMILIK